MKDVFLTPSAAAQFIKKSAVMVRIYADTGELPCIRTSTGVRLFRESDCLEFLRKRGGKRPTTSKDNAPAEIGKAPA
jgi:hypothetical protein